MATRRAVVLVLAIIVGIGDRLVADAPRTPAEVELRRTEVAGRVNALEEEADALTASLAMIAERLDAAPSVEIGRLREEQERLLARQQGLQDALLDLRKEYLALSAIRTRSATGPLYAADPQGLGPLDLSGAGDQVTAGRAFNPAISIIPDANYYTDNRRGRASTLHPARRTASPWRRTRTPPLDGSGSRVQPARSGGAFAGTIDPVLRRLGHRSCCSVTIQTEEAYVQTRVHSGAAASLREVPERHRLHQPAASPPVGLLRSGTPLRGHPRRWHRRHRRAGDLASRPCPSTCCSDSRRCRVRRRVASYWRTRLPRCLRGARRTAAAHRLPSRGARHRILACLQIGRPYAGAAAHQEVIDAGDHVDDGREGPAWLAGADIVWRHESGRAYGHGNATVQAEYLFRNDTRPVTAPRTCR
jgi:hypothetical protein